MTEIDIWLVDSFTDTPLSGNAAGVVLDADGLDEEACRQIAGELGVSETAFVFPGESEGADFHIRFFTRTQEVDLCGHATIAAFWVLAEEGRIDLDEESVRVVQETCLGNLPVWIRSDDGKPLQVMMGQRIPRFETPEVNVDKLSAIFGVGRGQLTEEHPIEIVSTGLRSLHIPLAGISSFGELKPLRRSIIDLSTSLDVGTIQVFTLETLRENADAHCRVFAPALGIEEDPVTGTAAGALGAYMVRHGLASEGKDGLTKLVVEQGDEMGRPGLVDVEIERDDEEFMSVRAGGRAVVSLKGTLKVPR